MGSYINRGSVYTDAGAGAGAAIPLNRWTTDDYTIAASGGTFDVSFEGTISRINVLDEAGADPITPVWFPIASSQLTAAGSFSISGVPLEAIRPVFVSQTGTTTIQVMQQGESGL